MKKMIAGLFAGLILATGAQAIAYGCEDGACELPQRQNTAYCYGGNSGYWLWTLILSERTGLLGGYPLSSRPVLYCGRISISNDES